MSSLPKRRLLQIHLTSAIWLTAAAGVLIGANIKEHREREAPFYSTDDRAGIQYFGWPMPACYRRISFEKVPQAGANETNSESILAMKYEAAGGYQLILDDAREFDLFGFKANEPWRPWNSWFLIDLSAALGIVFVPVLLNELYLRRRDRRALTHPDGIRATAVS